MAWGLSDQPPVKQRTPGRSDWLLAVALVAAVFVAYHPAWHGG
jgi:hypothetical protein